MGYSKEKQRKNVFMQLPVFLWLPGVHGNTISIRFGNHRNSFPAQLLTQTLFIQYQILCYTEYKQQAAVACSLLYHWAKCMCLCRLGMTFFMYFFQRCFTCRPSDSFLSEDSGFKRRTDKGLHFQHT